MFSKNLQPLSYKDPAGYVIEEKGIFYRYIHEKYFKEFDHIMHSGLYDRLIQNNWMVSHEELDTSNFSYKKILPEQIGFISYAYEWTYTQWWEVAIRFLEINLLALEYGMILKDATPYNFTFHKGRAILIDSLSFSFYTDGQPWNAYKQFCESILGPIALMHYSMSLWSRLNRTFLTGFPLFFISKTLPLKSYFNFTCLIHIHIHQLFRNVKQVEKKQNYFSQKKLELIFQQIKEQLQSWNHPAFMESNWKKYYLKDIENEAYIHHKIEIVQEWLNDLHPSTCIDLGSNTGKFSELASKYAREVIAIESDIEAADIAVISFKKTGLENIQVIQADIVEPSPGLGWQNEEKKPLSERLHGDLLMALALIHHLCFGRNLPLPFIADYFSKITTDYLIIEFVPKNDNKVKMMLEQREDIFTEYTEAYFLLAFQQYFDLMEQKELVESQRKLYLWKRK